MIKQVSIMAARYWPDAHGGVETHLWHFSRQLARAGVRVQVMTEDRSCSPEHQVIGSRHTVWRRPPVDPGRLWRWRPLVRVHWWWRWLRANPPSGAIWVTDPAIAAAVLWAGFGHRLIYNPAGCVTAMRYIGRVHRHVTSMQLPWMTQQLDRFVYRYTRCIVVSSINLKNQYLQYCGDHDRIHVIPLAAVTPKTADPRAARERWKINDGTFVIGFVGRLDPCKDLDFLFDAAQDLCRRRHTKLLIVGRGPDRDRLRDVARRRDLLSHVLWEGQMSDPTPAYHAMDVLVLPSIYESFGLVALEAMTHGVPVLARGGDGRRVMTAADEIVGHGHSGYVVDPHDPSDLARRLVQLESAFDRRHAMSTAARRDSRSKTWRRYTQRCLSELLGSPVTDASSSPTAVHRQAA